MTIDTDALRALTREALPDEGGRSAAAWEADACKALDAAADELDRLTTALTTAPHSTLCSYMVDHFHETCSCWKADPSPAPVGSITATTITANLAPPTLDDALDVITSLTVAGPHGRVLGLPRIRHPRLEFRGPALTIHYDNPEATT